MRRTLVVSALAVVTLAAGSLSAQTLLYRATPSFTSLGYGTAITTVGDLDGDGRDEFVVGGAGFAPFGGGTLTLHEGATGNVVWQITNSGPPEWRRLGGALDSISDRDGDGLRDIVAGAPTGADVSALGDPVVFQAGEVRIHSSADGSLIERWSAAGLTDRFGADVATMRDLNGDGIQEVAVSALAGYVEVRSGADGSVVARIDEGATSAALEFDVEVLSDLTADGSPELAMGRVGTDNQDGRVEVRSLDGSLLWLVEGGPGERLGRSLSVADVDGDGTLDVVAGGAGFVRVFSGADGSLLRDVPSPGPQPGAFGSTVDGLGDLDDDGRDEVVVGVSAGLNAAWILRGDGSLRQLHSTNVSATLNSSVARVGDVDGDGRQDLAVGLTGVLSASSQVVTLSGPKHVLVYSSRTLPFLEVGEGSVSGVAGFPALTGSGLTASGQPVTVELTQGAPMSLAAIAVGPSIKFFGPEVLPAVDVSTLLFGTTDAAGRFSVSGRWPSLPLGAMLFAQGLVDDSTAAGGVAASTLLQMTTARP